MGFQEIFNLDVPLGKLAITWLNSYSGVIIKTPEAILIFDPVKVSLEECVQANAIVITHEHLDHFAPKLARELQQKTRAPILTTPFIATNLLNESVRAMRVGDSVVIKDTELYALRCDHPANDPLSFIVSTESGITIYHSSDGEAFPEMIEIAETYKPDILLCVGASQVNAAQIARLVNPKVAISFYTDSGSEKSFIEVMRREAPETQVKIIRRFEIYQYPEF